MNEFTCEIDRGNGWELATLYMDILPSDNMPLGRSAAQQALDWLDWMENHGCRRENLRVRQTGWAK